MGATVGAPPSLKEECLLSGGWDAAGGLRPSAYWLRSQGPASGGAGVRGLGCGEGRDRAS